eukprot:symbB.v1.2.024585.t1/scaffold2337.1/size81945/1
MISGLCRVSLRTGFTKRIVLPGVQPSLLRWHRSVVDENAEQISFHFKLRDGSRKTVSVDLEGACEASLACSTCHIILAPDDYKKYGEPTEKEEDLLDLAPCLTPTSRLACQVVVDERLKDQEISLPAMTLNFYVDGHVPTPH